MKQFKHVFILYVNYTMTKKKQQQPMSDSDSDSSYDPETDSKISSEYTECSSDEELTASSSSEMSSVDKYKFKKMLSKMFPSKYMSKKVSKMKKLKRKSKYSSDEDEYDNSSFDGEETSGSEDEKFSRKRKPSKTKKVETETDEDDYDSSSLAEEETKNYGIILTVDGFNEDESVPELKFDNNEECGSEDEKTFMKETYEKLDIPESPSIESKDQTKKKSKKSKPKKSKKSKKCDSSSDEKEVDIDSDKDVEKKYLELVELKKQFVEQLKKHPKNKILLKSIQQCKDDIHKLVKESRNNNAKAYHKLVHSEKIRTDEMEYFRKKLSNQEQMRIMNDLKEINQQMYIDKPYRLALLESKIPAKYKTAALKRLDMLNSMDPGDNEYYKIKNWVDTFMRIPFGIYRNVSVSMNDGIDICHNFMQNAKNTLDSCVYGLNDAKMQIMQMIGQWIVNPNAMGTAIAIHGPPGTGKTSIVKDGISKILGREFAFIPLGGSGDSSFLEGHSYTYEGSTWGKIVQVLIDSKCMNPVFYFDELDKVSDSARGQEIIGVLTHLTDTSQNSQYHDKYFSDIDFDLSKCLFIFSYNDEHAVNPILKDRMYRIQTSGYDVKEKIKIAKDYLLPKIREQVKFTAEEVIINDDILNYLISNPKFTKSESGVRNLKRCLEIIYTKLNLFRLTKSDTKLFDKEMDIQITFPITVTKKEVDLFIKGDAVNPSILAMYV